MNRKLVSLLLALMLMMTAVVYAEGLTPSKTNGAMTQVELPANVPPEFNIDIKTETDYSKEVFAKVDTFLKEGGKVVEFFPAATMAAIVEQLPAGFDTGTLQVNELMPLDVSGISADMPELTLKFEFPTRYDPKDNVVTLVGCAPEEEGEDTQWIVTPCAVDVDGKLDITFTAETLTEVAAGDAVLTVLSGTPSETEAAE